MGELYRRLKGKVKNESVRFVGAKLKVVVAVWHSGNTLDSILSLVSTGMGDRVRVRLLEAALYIGM